MTNTDDIRRALERIAAALERIAAQLEGADDIGPALADAGDTDDPTTR
jgi:hypothetical protein